MPFDTLPNRLGPIQEQQFQAQPPPPVYPINDIVAHGVESINNVIEKFGPLAQSERKALIAKNAVIAKAYALGQSGDNQGMNDLLQYVNGHADPFSDELKHAQAMYYKSHSAYYDKGGPQAGRSGGADPIRQSRIIAAMRDRGGLTPEDANNSRRAFINTDNRTGTSLGDISLNKDEFPPVKSGY